MMSKKCIYCGEIKEAECFGKNSNICNGCKSKMSYLYKKRKANKITQAEFDVMANSVNHGNLSRRVHKETLCWDCQNAVVGCSWSSCFEPVPGWTAVPQNIRELGRITPSYHVEACPEFVPDEPRRNDRRR